MYLFYVFKNLESVRHALLRTDPRESARKSRRRGRRAAVKLQPEKIINIKHDLIGTLVQVQARVDRQTRKVKRPELRSWAFNVTQCPKN